MAQTTSPVQPPPAGNEMISVDGDKKHGDKNEIPSEKVVQSNPPDSSSQVDHGILCWLQLTASFAMWANSWGIVNSYGVFQTYYQVINLSNKSPSDISWIGSLQTCFIFLGGGLTGPLMDAGAVTYLNLIGNFLVVFGMMMTSLCEEYWQVLLAQGFVTGIGCGFLFLPAAALIPQYFVKRRALATCFAAAGSAIGGLIYPIVFRNLQPKIGFGWAVRVIAFIALFFALVSIALARNKIPPRPARKLLDSSLYKHTPMLVLTVGLFFAIFGLYVPIAYIGVFAIEEHITDANLGFNLVAITQAGSLLGRIGPAIVADKLGPYNLLTISIICYGVLCLCWIAIKNTAGLIVFAVLYGTFYGLVLGVIPGAYMSLLKGDMKKFGTIFGSARLVLVPAALVGNPVSGAILRSGAGFVGLQAFSGCMLALAGIFAVVGRVLFVGWGMAKA